MPQVLNTLRSALHYRKEAFDAGLRACGYEVVQSLNYPKPGDLLVIWNRYGGYHEQAARFERHGAKVLVAENGYLGKSWRGGDWFSLALWHHAGAGAWPSTNGPARWNSWSVELKPWKYDGDDVVIFGQRGIGEPGVRCPDGWADRAKALTGGRIRAHPAGGQTTQAIPLSEDLKNAGSAVTWNSAAGLISLILGVPVWCAWPQWIGAGACTPLDQWGRVDPLRSDTERLRMFERMAWALWNLEEIRSGEALNAIINQ